MLSDDAEDVQHTPGCVGHRQPYVSLVVEELIETERSYVKDLYDVVHVSTYLRPFDRYGYFFRCKLSFLTFQFLCWKYLLQKW